MKEMKKVFGGMMLCVLVLPLMGVGQTYGNEINAILEAYFDSAENKSEEAQNLPKKEAEKLIGIDILTEEEWQYKNRQLDLILQKSAETVSALERLRAQSQASLVQLQSLDAELSVRAETLSRLQAQQAVWQAEYEKRKSEKAFLDTIIQDYESELADLLRGEFMTAEKLQRSPDWVAMAWVFGEKTASVLQEERYQALAMAGVRASAIAQTQAAQNEIEKEMTVAGIFVRRLKELKEEVEAEEQAISRITKQKAEQMLAIETEKKEREKENQIISAQVFDLQRDLETQKQNEEALRAQNANPVAEISIEDQIDMFGFFGKPFAGPATITAGFLDQAHAKEIGQDHFGVDFKLDQGTPLFAMASGTVRKVALADDGYSFVEIDHGGGWRTVFGHVSEAVVYSGQKIQKGEKIAYSGGQVGTAGAGALSSGPHLHLEIKKENKYIYPALVLDFLE